MVHGPGAVGRLGEVCPRARCRRRPLGRRQGCRRRGARRARPRSARRPRPLRRRSPEPRHRARRRRAPPTARKAATVSLRSAAAPRSTPRRRSASRSCTTARSSTTSTAGPADPAGTAARRDPDDRRNGQRSDVLGRDHRSRAADQVQRRRHALIGPGGTDRSGADARSAARGHRRDRPRRAVTWHRMLHLRLCPADFGCSRTVGDGVRRAVPARRLSSPGTTSKPATR